MNTERGIHILMWVMIIFTTAFVTFTGIKVYKLQKTYVELNEQYLFIMQGALAKCNPGAHFIVSEGEITGCVVDNKTCYLIGGYWTDTNKLEACGCDKP